MIVLVAAVGRNGVIGADGKLPWHLPEDLARFKSLTMGRAIVMGRATFESIGKPLPGRHNIVLSRDPALEIDGVTVVSGADEAVETARSAGSEDVMVIGGGQIYREFLASADRLELTRVDLQPEGDTTFPPFSAEEWKLADEDRRPGPPAVAYQTWVRR